jgi:two-component system sensor histidine kinase PilS (NtrC family)
LEDSIAVIKQDCRFPFLNCISTDIKPQAKILGYSDKLKQVFINILVNAAQALETVEKKELRVSLELGSDQVLISFIDTGIGMSEQTMQKIFEPFHTTKPKGTGLGMAIVLKIIELHKGKIFVESQVGLGTKIELHFPRVQN